MSRNFVYLLYYLLWPFALVLGLPSFLYKGWRRGGLARNFQQVAAWGWGLAAFLLFIVGVGAAFRYLGSRGIQEMEGRGMGYVLRNILAAFGIFVGWMISDENIVLISIGVFLAGFISQIFRALESLNEFLKRSRGARPAESGKN